MRRTQWTRYTVHDIRRDSRRAIAFLSTSTGCAVNDSAEVAAACGVGSIRPEAEALAHKVKSGRMRRSSTWLPLLLASFLLPWAASAAQLINREVLFHRYESK